MASASSYQPSMFKMLGIFVVSSIVLLLINDLVFYSLFKGSFVRDQSQFVKKSEINEFRSTLNLTVDQRAEIAVSKEVNKMGQMVRDATGKLRDLIYQERDVLSKQIGAKTVEIQNEIADENSKLKEQIDSEHSKLKTELESFKKELNKKVSTLEQDLEAIQKSGDLDQSIDELRQKLKQVDVNKAEAEFLFEIKGADEFLHADSLSATKLSEFFQCRGISWYLSVMRTREESAEKPSALVITLFPHNKSDNHDWKIKTDIEIGILNRYGGANMTNEAEYTYRKERPNDGYSQFVTVDELHEDDFIKDDSIWLFVNLKADKLIRSSLV